MKRYSLLTALVLAAAGTGGCLVIHSEKTTSPRPGAVEPEDVTMREIDAVATTAVLK